MASFIDMSLEDIIQKRRKENKRSKMKPKTAKPKGSPKSRMQKLPVVDARNKIISKNRTQITDAREKLAELAKHKDARLKLDMLRNRRNAMVHPKARNMFNKNSHPFMRMVQNKERVFIDPSRQVHSQPLGKYKVAVNRQFNNRKNLESRSFENRSFGIKTNKFSVNVSNWKSAKNTGRAAALKPIVRTVENDIEILEMYDDPMDGDIRMDAPKVSSNRKTSLQLKIIAHNTDLYETKSSVVHRNAPIEREKSPPRPPSILKKRPMAALRTEKKVEKPEKSNTEYRIIVSSLGTTVTAGDIEELFGDVGGMIESRLVRPGTAEVIYKTLEDAQKAVDLYHKRQLDGQPMNCLLVTPRSNAASQKSATKPGLHSTNSNVEPDLSTFHKVLFSNF